MEAPREEGDVAPETAWVATAIAAGAALLVLLSIAFPT